MKVFILSGRFFAVCFCVIAGVVFSFAQTPCHVRSVDFSPPDFQSCEIPATANFQALADLDSTPVLLDTRFSSVNFRQAFNFNFSTGDNSCYYVLKISGSYSVWSNPTQLIDARFRFHPVRNDSLNDQEPEGLNIPPPAFVQPAGYNPDHEYWFFYEGNGQNVPVSYADNGQYSDNSGNLTFEWFAIPCFETVWTFEGTDYTDVNNLTLNFQQAVNSPLRLRVLDLLTGCFKETSTVIRVSEAPDLSVVSENSCPSEATGFAQINPSGGLPPYQFSWSNGNPDAPIAESLETGQYQVTVTDANGCNAVATFEIESIPAPMPDLLTSPASCAGETDGSLEVVNPQPDWLFSLDGLSFQSNSRFNTLAAGAQKLYLQDAAGCTFEYDFEILSFPAIRVDLARQLDVQRGSQVTLTPQVSGGSGDFEFSWSPNAGLSCADCANPVLTADTDRSYTLTVTDKSGCQVSAMIFIQVKKTTGKFAYVPSAFSPNYDGLNDALTVFGDENIGMIKSFRVFDRWGALIFEANDIEPNLEKNGWNGEVKNKKAPNGIYVWTARLLWADGEESFLKGDVVLMR